MTTVKFYSDVYPYPMSGRVDRRLGSLGPVWSLDDGEVRAEVLPALGGNILGS
jgi:hypothetical protein